VLSRRLRAGGRAAWIGILSEEGLAALRRNGHESVATACAPDLPAGDVRFVDRAESLVLERGTESQLAELYASPLPSLPRVVAAHAEGRSATIELRVQPDLRWLQGHFPGLPVVPGAVQLGWALQFGAEMLGTPATMRAARSVKFERVIQPGRTLTLRLAAGDGPPTLRFEYASARGRYSSGRIETTGADG
jgi:hypothetical protein